MTVDPLILVLVGLVPALLTWLVARQGQPSEIKRREAGTISVLNNSVAQVVNQLTALSTENIDLRKQVALAEIKIAKVEDRADRLEEKFADQAVVLKTVQDALSESRRRETQLKVDIDHMPQRIDQLIALLESSGIKVPRDPAVDTARAAIDNKAQPAPEVPTEVPSIESKQE